ncbi:MAG: leucine-rich repeat domain-containing protein [Lachnospiraceae bacterium]|nr:leucine-rich repeat domain-containing protein [Lachnospiraceae bacterium]
MKQRISGLLLGLLLCLGLVFIFKSTVYAAITPITKITIDVQYPKKGEKAPSAISCSSSPSTTEGNCALDYSGYNWYKINPDTGEATPLGSEKIKSGYKYALAINLYSEYGYCFTSATKVETASPLGVEKIEIKDLDEAQDTGMTAYITYSLLSDIEQFTINGVKSPVAGKTSSTNTLQPANPDRYTISDAYWTETSSGRKLAENETFKLGGIYTLTVHAKATSLWQFTRNTTIDCDSSSAWLAERAEDDERFLVANFTFSDLKKPISKLSVTGIGLPLNGKAFPKESDIRISDPNVKLSSFSVVNTDGPTGEDLTTYKAGRAYLITVCLEAAEGYTMDLESLKNGGITTDYVTPSADHVTSAFGSGDEAIDITFPLIVTENCTIHFDANGGNGTMADLVVPSGYTYTLPACAFTAPAGKTFGGYDRGTPGSRIVISGNTTIKALWKDVPVVKKETPALGTLESGGGIYVITEAAGKPSVSFKRLANPVKKFTIPATIKANSVTYAVVSIEDGAFSGDTTLSSVVIGKNIKSIGQKAFFKCKKLKSVTIKTTKLKKKTVGAKAFKGIAGKAVFRLPSKKAKSYKRILLKKGATRRMSFKSSKASGKTKKK